MFLHLTWCLLLREHRHSEVDNRNDFSRDQLMPELTKYTGGDFTQGEKEDGLFTLFLIFEISFNEPCYMTLSALFFSSGKVTVFYLASNW